MRRALAFAAALLALAAPPALAGHGELLARWHLDVVDEGSTPDDSGHGLDGEANGGTTFVPGGRFGNALDVGGPGDSQIDVPDSSTLEPQRMTVVAWVYADAQPGANKYVLGKGGAGCSGSSYALTSGANGGLTFSVLNGTTQYVSPAAGTALWDGQWHAVAGQFDGATVRLWVDGAQVGTGTSAPVSVTYGTTFDDLRIGNYPASNFCAGGFVWPGLVDEVRIYDRALDAEEIGHLHGVGHVAPPNLPPPPVNTAAPSIGGSYGLLHPPDALTASPGGWTRSPASHQLQWMRCQSDGGACSEIAGATGGTYGVTSDDVGRAIRLRVRAVNAGGTSAPAFSAPSHVVQPPPPPQSVTPGGGDLLRDPRIPLAPRLVVSPDPACSGMPVTFDATGSSGPDRIVRYRFAYLESYDGVYRDFYKGVDEIRHVWGAEIVVADGPSPTAQHVFKPNTIRAKVFREGRILEVAPVRGNAHVYVDVWDARGRHATSHVPSRPQLLTFANRDNPHIAGRGCDPRDRLAPNIFAGVPLNAVSVAGSSLAATVPCTQRTNCRGLLTVTLASARAAQRGRRRATLIASTGFTIPAGKRRRVTARLTPAGRRLLRRGRVRARVALTGIGADGIPRTKRATVTLTRRR